MAEPIAADEVGLPHSTTILSGQEVNTGGVEDIHVTVREVVDVLPQASLAVNVLVWLREQVELLTCPSPAVTVGVTHPSVAVAVPSAPLISLADGLHPSVKVVPPAVMVGALISWTVTDLLQVAVLPHASLAVHVRVTV